VRLHGTNAKEGKQLLEEASKTNKKLKIIVGNDLDDAAKKAAAAAK